MKKSSKLQVVSLAVLIIMVGAAFADIFIELYILKNIIWLVGFGIQLLLLHKVGISLKSRGMNLFCLIGSSLGVVLSVVSIIVAII